MADATDVRAETVEDEPMTLIGVVVFIGMIFLVVLAGWLAFPKADPGVWTIIGAFNFVAFMLACMWATGSYDKGTRLAESVVETRYRLVDICFLAELSIIAATQYGGRYPAAFLVAGMIMVAIGTIACNVEPKAADPNEAT